MIMEAALIQTIIRVGVPALVSIADMFIALSQSINGDEPTIEQLIERRAKLRELPDLETYDGPEKDKG